MLHKERKRWNEGRGTGPVILDRVGPCLKSTGVLYILGKMAQLGKQQRCRLTECLFLFHSLQCVWKGKGKGKYVCNQKQRGVPVTPRDTGDCNWDQHSLQVQLAQVATEREAHETAENHVIWAKNAERRQGMELPERIPDLYKLDRGALTAVRWFPAPSLGTGSRVPLWTWWGTVWNQILQRTWTGNTVKINKSL